MLAIPAADVGKLLQLYMNKKQDIPGIIRPTDGFRSTDAKNHPRTIEEKRATVIRNIERHRSREKGAGRLEMYDYQQKAPVIRVLYGSTALPIFDGQPAAVIQPDADRDALWEEIITRIESGEYDRAIQEVASTMLNNLRQAQAKNPKRSRNAA
jgi:hypothetical protein